LPADVNAYRRIRLDALCRHPDVFGSSYEEESQLNHAEFVRMIESPPGCTLGGFAGSDLVGIAGLYVSSKKKQRHKGCVVGVYVLPEHRRFGLAERLLTELIAEGRRARLRVIELAVTVGNEPARQLYVRLGFQTYGIERFALEIGQDYLDEELMALVLA
jgi:ribosomal protein S18 acetylase RimI-like enzyme